MISVPPRRRAHWVLCLLAGTFCANSALADTVWIRSGEKGGALPFQNVKVLAIKDGELQYQALSSGRQASKPLENVTRILIDSEPIFSAAEQSFDEGDFKKAAGNYQKVVSAGASRDWMRERSGLRLVEAAGKSGDFATAVNGYIAILQRDPKLAKSAKPAVPADKAVAAKAIPDVQKALAAPRLTPQQRQPLELFLADLYHAAGQDDKASAVVDRLAQAPATGGGADAAAAEALQASVKLRAVALALTQKDYAKALADVDAAKALFTEPAQQADALYYRAEALMGLAKDDAGVADAALAYMRVAAHFKGAPGKPHVAEALLKTAALQERLKAPAEAAALYEQVANEFSGSPAAEQARQGLERVKPAAKGS